MNSSEPNYNSNPEFQSILVKCLAELEKGKPVDVAAITVAHPEFSEQVKAFLRDREALKNAVADITLISDQPHSGVVTEQTIDSSSGASQVSAGQKLRYVGEYEIIEEIARGGMGIVYRARQHRPNRDVALKMILSGQLANKNDVERFHREAQAAGKLQHRNIVAIHEVGEHDEHHYFTMDFVDGESLADKVRDKSLAPKNSARLVYTIAKAVDYAHSQGVLHRDLKPGNILIGKDGDVKITDFGLAKMIDGTGESNSDLTATGQVLGTPSYMSPEQATGRLKEVGASSDIYSLGAILYFCLTGRAPFVADSPVETLIQVRESQPVSPRTLNLQVPVDLDTVCLKSLEKDPGRRYQSAEEFSDDLRSFLEDRPVMARRVGPFGRATRWCRRNPVIAALTLLVAMSLALGTIISTYFAVSENRRAIAEAEAHSEAEVLRQQEQELREKANELTEIAQREKALAVDLKERMRRQLYVAQMNQAQSAWQERNVEVTSDVLKQHIPSEGEEDFRDFEWKYLNSLLESQTTFDTRSYQRKMCISPDGELLAITHPDVLSIWNLSEQKQVASLKSAEDAVYLAKPAFSSDGKLLAFAGQENKVVLHDVVSNTKVREFPVRGNGPICSIDIDQSHSYLVAASRVSDAQDSASKIECWNLQSGEKILSLDLADTVVALSFRPDSDVFATIDREGDLIQWNLHTGTQIRQWRSLTSPFMLTFNESGSQVATAGYGVVVQDANNGKTVKNFSGGDLDGIGDLSFHPDGEHIVAAGASKDVYLLNLKQGGITQSFKGHTKHINGVAFRLGMKQIVSMQERGMVKIWNTQSVQGRTIFNAPIKRLWEAAFTSDGKTLVASERFFNYPNEKCAIQLWDVASSEHIETFDGHDSGIGGLAIKDGERIAASGDNDGKLLIWDLDEKKILKQLDTKASVRSLDLHPTKSLVAVGLATEAPDRGVYVQDYDRDEVVYSTRNEGGECLSARFSPDGKRLAILSRRRIRVVHLDSGKDVLNQALGIGREQAFSPNGKWLACNAMNQILVYSTENWEVIKTIRAHSQQVTGLCFNSTSTRLASAGEERTVKLWETRNWQSTLTIQGKISKPVFSPNDKMLITEWSEDQVVATTIDADKTETVSSDRDLEFHLQSAHQLARLQLWDKALDEILRIPFGETNEETERAKAHYALMAGDLKVYRETTRRQLNIYEARGFEDNELNVRGWAAMEAQRWAAIAFMTDSFVNKSVTIEVAAQREWVDPKDTSSTIATLFFLLQSGQYEELLSKAEEFSAAVRWNVIQGQGDLFRAIAFYELDRLEEANAAMRRGVNNLSKGLPPVGRGRLIADGYLEWFMASIVIHEIAGEVALRKLNAAIDSMPTDQQDRDLLTARGYLHSWWQRWDESADDLQLAKELQPEDSGLHTSAAMMCLLAGRIDEYKLLAAEMEKAMDSPKFDGARWSIGRLCSLYPETIEDKKRMFKLSSDFMNVKRTWHCEISAVGVSFRTGETKKAAKKLAALNLNSTETGNKCTNHLWNSLINFRLNNIQEARDSFGIADQIMRQHAPSPGYIGSGQFGWTERIILHKELKRLLEE